MSNSDFVMSKWYADMIDDKTNDLSIAYLGTLKWKRLNLTFFNLIEFIDRTCLKSFENFYDYKGSLELFE